MVAVTVSRRLDEVELEVRRALEAVEADEGGTSLLDAAVKELAAAARAALRLARAGDEPALREQLEALEEAAHSARMAADSDGGLAPATRDAVLAAHRAVQELEAERVR